jgi:iron complex outermembrane receptor protein
LRWLRPALRCRAGTRPGAAARRSRARTGGPEASATSSRDPAAEFQDIPLSVTVGERGGITSGGADIRTVGRAPACSKKLFGRTFSRFYIRSLGNTDFDLNVAAGQLIYDDGPKPDPEGLV